MKNRVSVAKRLLVMTGFLQLFFWGCSLPSLIFSPSQDGQNFSIAYSGAFSSGVLPEDTGKYAKGSLVMVRYPGTLKRNGYVFKGWNTKLDGSGVACFPGSRVLIKNSDIILFAQWEQGDTIQHNGHGFTGGKEPVDPGKCNTGSSGTIKDVGILDVTFYAQWTQGPAYTVTYMHAGEPLDAGVPPEDTGKYPNGASVTLKGSGSMKRTGYYFKGWTTAKDGSGTIYKEGSTCTIGISGMTFYAQWAENHTVTYIITGVAGSGGVRTIVDPKRYPAGASVILREEVTSPPVIDVVTRTFAGWMTKVNGVETVYPAQSTYTMENSNVFFYDKWKKDNTYTIVYDGNGATEGEVPMDDGRYTLGTTRSPVTLKDQGSLKRTGYTFQGWGDKKQNGFVYSANMVMPSGLYTSSVQSRIVTLYAYWKKSPPAVIVSSVSFGGRHTMVIKTDGTLWATGSNQYGQLGIEDASVTSVDTMVKIMSDVSAVSAGGGHTMVIKTDGTLWGVGRNNHGQLGIENKSDQTFWILITEHVSAVSTGMNHSLVLKTNGILWATGENNNGQLGIGGNRNGIPRDTTISSNDQTVWKPIANHVVDVSAGAVHTVFVKTDGTLWVTGKNNKGQLGIDTSGEDIRIPQKTSMQDVSSVSSGGLQIVKKDGTIWKLGSNRQAVMQGEN